MAKWVVKAKRADFYGMAEKYHINPVIARIIRNRDLTEDAEIEKFLHGTLEDLYSPYALQDVKKAADIILQKIAEQKKIRVMGDYDIDGVCATYILVKGLEYLGANVDAVIPHRILDGYGLNDSLITQAKEDGVDTILTCDNGIAAAAQIAYAKEFDMTVVVTDHHEVPYEMAENGERLECLPKADAVVDPKRADCTYPFEEICGAVVAYKLLQVLLQERKIAGTAADCETEDKALLQELLAFAAFATVGDVMELVDENRILVKYGLKEMEETPNLGLRALIEVNGLQNKPLSVYHLGFVMGPCLNATGRLDTALRALQMFQTKDWAEAVTIAGELKELNDSRKNMTLQGTEAAIAMIDGSSLQQDKVLVVYLPECHESLAGIIAGRLREHYQKPAFVLTKAEEGVKGSGRSIEAYHMYDKMSECKELYIKYGGHKLAAGVSMPEENVDIFRKFLNDHCQLHDEDLEEKVRIDVPMPMSYATKEFVKQLSVLEPFGNGNPKPIFAQKGVTFLRGRILGKNQNVAKYVVSDEQGQKYDMLYFGNLDKWHAFLEETFGEEQRQALYQGSCEDICISVIYYPDINVYQGREQLQMIMKDYSI